MALLSHTGSPPSVSEPVCAAPRHRALASSTGTGSNSSAQVPTCPCLLSLQSCFVPLWALLTDSNFRPTTGKASTPCRSPHQLPSRSLLRDFLCSSALPDSASQAAPISPLGLIATQVHYSRSFIMALLSCSHTSSHHASGVLPFCHLSVEYQFCLSLNQSRVPEALVSHSHQLKPQVNTALIFVCSLHQHIYVARPLWCFLNSAFHRSLSLFQACRLWGQRQHLTSLSVYPQSLEQMHTC